MDPKAPRPADGRWAVYVSAREDAAAIERELRAEEPAADFEQLSIRPLPADPEAIPAFGILYLPKPYVVPGGRFNEMYGWDSYFIVLGLLDDGYVDLARDIVENHIYEIEKYSTILNANRTYYLTRSQPPFFTRMILEVYGATHDKEWLRGTLNAALAYHRFWTSPPHLTPETGSPDTSIAGTARRPRFFRSAMIRGTTTTNVSAKSSRTGGAIASATIRGGSTMRRAAR